MGSSDRSSDDPLEAGAEERLLRWTEADLTRLDTAELNRLLTDPHLTTRVIRRILAQEKLLERRLVRRAIAAHRATPFAEAQRLIATLFWSDLVELGRDAAVRPAVRRAANRALLERYEGLAIGERIAIVRRAGTELLTRVRHDPEPRVVAAMLDNPRLTEGLLLPVVASGRSSPRVLTVVAESTRWVARYQVRRLLCRNRKTPLEISLSLLPRLKKADLKALENDPAARPEVRRRAALLLGGEERRAGSPRRR